MIHDLTAMKTQSALSVLRNPVVALVEYMDPSIRKLQIMAPDVLYENFPYFQLDIR
jgi:hypothetical protein